MAFLLHLRGRKPTNKNTFTNPSLFHFFSSTANSNDDDDDDPPPPFSSYFNDVKKVLKQDQPTSSFSTPRNPFASSPTPFKASTLDEIRNNLAQFRRRVSDFDSTTPPPPSPSPSSGQISLQEIYWRNMAGESAPIADSRVGKIGGSLSFDAIRESVRSRRTCGGSERNEGGGLSSSISAFSEGLRKGNLDSTASIFGKE